MFPSFAARIREQLPLLIEQSDALLGKLPGYDQLPAASRHDLERRMLGVITDSIDTGNTVKLHQYIRERAAQVQAYGFRLEQLQQAVAVSQDVVIPLAKDAAESNFVWRVLTGAQAIISGIIIRELQRQVEAAEAAKQALQESEQRLHTDADVTHGWETRLTSSGRYIYVSPACERISGYSPQEFIDRPELFVEIAHGEDRAIVEDHFFQHLSTRDTAPLEFRIVTRDGQVRWINHVCVPVRDAQGNFQGRRGSNTDITARKQAEETVGQSTRLFQSLFEKSADAILLLEDGIFTDCNQAAVEMMHAADKQQFLSMHPLRLSPEIQPDGRPSGEKADEMIRTALEQGSHRFEWTHRRMDGSDFPVEVSLTPITIDERQVIYTVWRDITRRKQLEQVWQQSLERRGRQVQTSTEVAQEIAAAPALDELFTRVVTLIKERFGYYHAQLLRYDPAQDAVVLVVGYGEVGQRMLAGGHRLQMGRGVVGTAAATGRSILAANVADDKDWQPNPDLPATQGELAVPIKLRGDVLGILDVQSDQTGALTQEDQLLLEGLCGQIAVAIESRRVEDNLRERELELSKFKLGLDRSTSAIFITDRQGTITYVNPAFEKIYGYSAAEAIGQTPRILKSGIIPPEQYRNFWVALLSGQSIAGEIINRTKDGRLIPVDGVNTPIPDEAGQIVGFLAMHADITERKQEEQRMAETLREMERLYAMTSHKEWQTYRDSKQLPSGYLFSRLEIQPASQIWEPEISRAIAQHGTVATHDEQRSLVVTPLAVRGEIIGALGLYDHPDQPLTPEDVALVEAASEQVALALESARLFDQIQRDAERERTINRITGQIRNASSVDEVLEIATQELSVLTHASRSVAEIKPAVASHGNIAAIEAG